MDLILKTLHGYKINYCPQCGNKLEEQLSPSGTRLVCARPGCGYVHYDNPTPVLAIIVETPEGVVLAHNRQWPVGMFSLISGFLECGETSEECAQRETCEELGLEPGAPVLIGVYPFHPKYQLILAYPLHADGEVIINDELDDFKVTAEENLQEWSFAAGWALTDWLAVESTEAP